MCDKLSFLSVQLVVKLKTTSLLPFILLSYCKNCSRRTVTEATAVHNNANYLHLLFKQHNLDKC
jgi:hypothetical protein